MVSECNWNQPGWAFCFFGINFSAVFLMASLRETLSSAQTDSSDQYTEGDRIRSLVVQSQVANFPGCMQRTHHIFGHNQTAPLNEWRTWLSLRHGEAWCLVCLWGSQRHEIGERLPPDTGEIDPQVPDLQKKSSLLHMDWCCDGLIYLLISNFANILFHQYYRQYYRQYYKQNNH